MPCCGLIAFLFGQPFLFWNAFRSWLAGDVPFLQASRLQGPISLGVAGSVVLAELVLFGLGAALTLELRQLDVQITEAAMIPWGRICSLFDQTKF